VKERVIYVSGPYTEGNGRSREANIAAAYWMGCQVRELELGLVPFVPHIAVLPFPPGGDDWKPAMRECLAHLRRHDALVVLPTWRESRGARIEVWLARRRWGIPVMDLEDLAHWARTGVKAAA